MVMFSGNENWKKNRKCAKSCKLSFCKLRRHFLVSSNDDRLKIPDFAVTLTNHEKLDTRHVSFQKGDHSLLSLKDVNPNFTKNDKDSSRHCPISSFKSHLSLLFKIPLFEI